MTLRRFLVSVCAWTFPVLGLYSSAALAEGQFRAVVAIATKYSNQLSAQPTLVKAAPELDRAFRTYARRLGYSDKQIEIKLLLDVDGVAAKAGYSSADEIKAAVYDAAIASTEPEDTLIFYFTGHGSSDGSNIILFASGADGRRPIARVSLESEILTTRWRQSRAGIKLIAIDACQVPLAGALNAGSALLGNGTLAALEGGSSVVTGSQGTAMFFAADEGAPAWVDDTNGYGFFTRHFLALLSVGNETTAQSFSRSVRRLVSEDVQKRFANLGRSQRPEMRVLASPGGDYRLTTPLGRQNQGASANQPMTGVTSPKPPSTVESQSSRPPPSEQVSAHQLADRFWRPDQFPKRITDRGVVRDLGVAVRTEFREEVVIGSFLSLAQVCHFSAHFAISSAASPHGCWGLLQK